MLFIESPSLGNIPLPTYGNLTWSKLYQEWRLHLSLGLPRNGGGYPRTLEYLRVFLSFLLPIQRRGYEADTFQRDGDDGSWSSFALRIGSPEQTVRVLPSTTGRQTWVVSTEGCPIGSPGTSTSPSCDDSRGGLFDTTQSSSWQVLGNYSLDLESNLGYDETALFGLDTVALGFDNSTGGPTIDSQVMSTLATDDYYIGVFGLSPNATTLDNYTDPHSSFLTAMHNRSLIPSLSWAYTAGAPYRESIS